MLRCHYRAYAGAAGSPVHVIDHAGESATVFGAGPYRGKVDQRILVGLLDGLFRFPHGPAPQVSGGQQACPFVFDMEVNGFRRPAFQDQQIIAGKFQFGAELAAGVGTGDGIRQCALGDDGIAPAGGGHGAGQGSGCKDYFIFRRQGIDTGVDFFKQVFCPKSPLSQVGLRPFLVQRFDGAVQFGQVDA